MKKIQNVNKFLAVVLLASVVGQASSLSQTNTHKNASKASPRPAVSPPARPAQTIGQIYVQPRLTAISNQMFSLEKQISGR